VKSTWLFLVGGVLFCTIVASGAVAYQRWSFQLTSEYRTAGVIRQTREFVERSGGQWPRSWSDLGEDGSAYTVMNFTLAPEQATETEVLSAIKPVSGGYQTYPHARHDLEWLYETLRNQREKQRAEKITAEHVLE
jgi:hypothetical protein